jgi:hypothetical protein
MHGFPTHRSEWRLRTLWNGLSESDSCHAKEVFFPLQISKNLFQIGTSKVDSTVKNYSSLFDTCQHVPCRPMAEMGVLWSEKPCNKRMADPGKDRFNRAGIGLLSSGTPRPFFQLGKDFIGGTSRIRQEHRARPMLPADLSARFSRDVGVWADRPCRGVAECAVRA